MMAAGIVCIGLAIAWAVHEIRPIGEEGPAADRLARRMERQLGVEHWNSTGAVRFEFIGGLRHLWDRKRQLSRLSWKDNVVWVDLQQQTGVAERNGKRLSGIEAQELIDFAIKRWNNDGFWLTAAFKTFDPGVRRELVIGAAGDSTLAVHYDSGGSTPGDSYQWFFDKSGKPVSWKMWVSIIPIGGISVSFPAWTKTATGAVLPSQFTPFSAFEIKGIDTAENLEMWFPDRDPFARLF